MKKYYPLFFLFCLIMLISVKGYPRSLTDNCFAATKLLYQIHTYVCPEKNIGLSNALTDVLLDQEFIAEICSANHDSCYISAMSFENEAEGLANISKMDKPTKFHCYMARADQAQLSFYLEKFIDKKCILESPNSK